MALFEWICPIIIKDDSSKMSWKYSVKNGFAFQTFKLRLASNSQLSDDLFSGLLIKGII